MECAESNNGNTKQPLYDGIQMNKIYYYVFDDYQYVDGAALQYGQEINDQNTEVFYEAYVEDLDKYIGNHVMEPSKDSNNFLSNVKDGKL